MHTPNKTEVVSTLHHGLDVFADPQLSRLEALLNLDRRVGSPTARPHLIEAIVEAVRPTVVVELGVYKGWTSIYFAKTLARLGLQSSFVISIDTWLLDLRFTWRQKSTYLRGYPSIAGGVQMYVQFLHNVKAAGQQSRIVPMQSATTNAAHAFFTHRWQADVAYVDASHTSIEVFSDMEYWWPLVRCGGIMFGDDMNVPAVEVAVLAFERKHNLTGQYSTFRGRPYEPRFWLFEKNSSSRRC